MCNSDEPSNTDDRHATYTLQTGIWFQRRKDINSWHVVHNGRNWMQSMYDQMNNAAKKDWKNQEKGNSGALYSGMYGPMSIILTGCSEYQNKKSFCWMASWMRPYKYVCKCKLTLTMKLKYKEEVCLLVGGKQDAGEAMFVSFCFGELPKAAISTQVDSR